MGDTGYQLARTAQGRSDRGRVSYPGIRVPGVAVYDSDAVLCIPLPAAIAFDDETRSAIDGGQLVNSHVCSLLMYPEAIGVNLQPYPGAPKSQELRP